MAKEIVWTKSASSKIDLILIYLHDNWSDRVTSNFIKKVYDLHEILSEFPEIRTIENKSKNIRGFSIVKQVRLFYKIKGSQLILLNFFDNR